MLNSAGRVLSSFNGAKTTTLGAITLPIQAGPITLQVLFSIVQDLGPYNCIVGQTWLYSMKVVPSTYHHIANYLTNARQVDLLSSQLAARQCYQLSIQEQKEERAQIVFPSRLTFLYSNHNSSPRSGQKKRIR